MPLTTMGLKYLAGRGTANTLAPLNYICVGDSSLAFNKTQSECLGVRTFRKQCTSVATAEPSKMRFKTTFGPDEGNFPWNEWGIFNQSAGGYMLNRVVKYNGTKTQGHSWTILCEVELIS